MPFRYVSMPITTATLCRKGVDSVTDMIQSSCLSPVACRDERRPVKGVRACALRAMLLQNTKSGRSDGFGCGRVLSSSRLVERTHPESGRLVIDRPEAHDHCS